MFRLPNATVESIEVRMRADEFDSFFFAILFFFSCMFLVILIWAGRTSSILCTELSESGLIFVKVELGS